MWPAIIGGLLGLGGMLGGSDAQRKANHEELDFLRESRTIGIDMANTSYQRAVKDMMAAGLSPMLAYSQGGAPVPSSPGSPSLENTVGAGMSSAMQGMSMVSNLQQVSQSQAQTDLLNAQARKTETETMEHGVNTAYRAEELKRIAAEAAEKKVSADVARRTQHATESGRIADGALKELEREARTDTFSADVARRKAESVLTQQEIPKSKAEADFWKDTGELTPALKMLMQLLRMGNSARSLAR